MKADTKNGISLSGYTKTFTDEKTGKLVTFGKVELLEPGFPTVEVSADAAINLDSFKTLQPVDVVFDITTYGGKLRTKVLEMTPTASTK